MWLMKTLLASGCTNQRGARSHRPRENTEMIKQQREEVSRDFSGKLIVANDLDKIEV